MSIKVEKKKSKLFQNKLIANSAWGTISNIIQNIFLSIFFIIISREYSIDEFGSYVVSNTLYSIILGFSSLGLGHWFIREVINNENKKEIINKFFKTQLLIGIAFYIICIICSFLLYDNPAIRTLSIIIGINLIFDNIINVIKSLNIANEEQKKTFILLIIEAILKTIVACFLLFFKIDIVLLTVILITLRFITLNLFIKIGSSNDVSLLQIIKVKVNWIEIKKIVLGNWAFIVISSVSVLNWRIGNILVSKFLTLKDVADYEVSFKLLSLAYLPPIIVTSSIYPLLLKALKINLNKLSELYKIVFIPLCVYGFLSFTFIFSFADSIIPLIFGNKFLDTSSYCKELFVIMLIFPTIFLQANVLVTIKLEKIDMYCNLISVVVNIILCFVGLYFFKSLSVINYSILISFLLFHLIQDSILIKRKITTITHVLKFYSITILSLLFYYFITEIISKEWGFVVFWSICTIAFVFYYRKNKATILHAINITKNNEFD